MKACYLLTILLAHCGLLMGQDDSSPFTSTSEDPIMSSTEEPPLDDPLLVDVGVLGRLRGRYGESYEHEGVRRRYVQFTNITYATIPQRFSPSTLAEDPLNPDGEIFNATTNGLRCPQPRFGLPDIFYEENCLRINIYTHEVNRGDDVGLRPVIFFIHGGAFTVGDGASFSGQRLMSMDVVYVSFNYRLGLLGFFSLENPDLPGNAGLYDAVNALKWTNKYIRYFGGDPNNITIAGQSAGGAMVTHLMASPMASGMFHRAIAASGSALNIWGTATDTLQESLRVANRTVCYNDTWGVSPDLAEIAECMRNISPWDLVDALYEFQISERREGRLGFSATAPVVQSFNTASIPKVVPEHPAFVFERGDQSDVPLLMSTVKHDGSYVLGVYYNRFLRDNGYQNDTNFLRTQFISTMMSALGIPDVPTGVHDIIASMYLGETKTSGDFNKMYPGLMDIFSVFFFKADCYRTAILHSRTSPTYWESFDYRGSMSFFNQLYPQDTVPPFPGGITHTDDMIYYFGLTFLPFTEDDAKVNSKKMKYWQDFATLGKPSDDWPELNNLTERYMQVDLMSTIEEHFKETWAGPGYEAPRPLPTTTPFPDTDDPLLVDAGNLGRIRGRLGQAYEHEGGRRNYVQFSNIPYATIPERFLPSILKEDVLSPNGEIFNATATGLFCTQPPFGLPPILFDDNCLNLNVFTHEVNRGDDLGLRPVIFYIHGGAFTVGNGASFSGARILAKDVVYVSFNYRLGLAGWFSLMNEDVPGNAGMYDVINALNWTSRYIKHFGGDPNAITITGQSAGSVVVTHLLASPVARGLFHNAIAASGSALNNWGTTLNPMKESLRISEKLNCYVNSTTPDFAEIASCMRGLNSWNLTEALLAYQIEERRSGRLGFSVVSPVVQDYDIGMFTKLIPEHPQQVFERGDQADVPLLMSTTHHDGSYVVGVVYNRFLKDNQLENNSTFLQTQLVPTVLNALGINDQGGIHEIITDTYLGDAKDSGNFQQMVPGLIDIFSVFFFKGDCYQTALLHSRKYPTYWESFEYRGSMSFWGQLFPGDGPMPFSGGVTHTDDMIYYFAITFLPYTPDDVIVNSKMMSYWEQMATVGKPSVDWPELNITTKHYMRVHVNNSIMQDFPSTWPGPGYDLDPATTTAATTTAATTTAPTTTTTMPTPTRVPSTTTSTTTTSVATTTPGQTTTTQPGQTTTTTPSETTTTTPSETTTTTPGETTTTTPGQTTTTTPGETTTTPPGETTTTTPGQTTTTVTTSTSTTTTETPSSSTESAATPIRPVSTLALILLPILTYTMHH